LRASFGSKPPKRDGTDVATPDSEDTGEDAMKAQTARLCWATMAVGALIVGCSSERPARSPSQHFESRVETAPASEARDVATERPAVPADDEEAQRADVSEEDKDARLAHEACACISRTATVRTADTPEGVRMIFQPHDRSDLERLERKVKALEDATETDSCELPGILSSAEDVELDVVDGALHVDIEADKSQRQALRSRVRQFAKQVASYGVVSPIANEQRGKHSRR
jgi:hypothetical protein